MITFNDIQIKYADFIAIDNLNLEIKEGSSLHFSDQVVVVNQQPCVP